MDDLSHAIGRLGSVSPGPDRVPAEVLKELPMEMKQQLLQEIKTRGAPDSGFRYPAGYRIGRIVPSYPAG